MSEVKSDQWIRIKEYKDILFDRTEDGVAKITINRPEVRNAFRPQTVHELKDAFEIARENPRIGVVVLTGAGPDAFCSGGDQKVRGTAGYVGRDGQIAWFTTNCATCILLGGRG